VTAYGTNADAFAELPSGIRICYRTRGDAAGEPLLLVAGLGQHLTAWPEPLLDGLVARGFRVIHHDNRDVGRSSRIDAPAPSTARQFLLSCEPSLRPRLLARPLPGAYTLQDMADDAVGLLDHLGVERAHLVGMSMGGMIAQTVAASHPGRAVTLTSLCSTTGDRRVGQPARSTLAKLAKPPARTREDYVRNYVAIMTHLSGTGFPLDPAVETAYAEGAWDRGGANRNGMARQIQAIQASGDRSAQLARITAPTLVVHGDRDLIVHPTGGRATAEAIPGARLVTVAGMGHQLAPGVLDRLLDLITDHCRLGAKR
jgi:pimeloyl-ACP methyl ester carboxylesterase